MATEESSDKGALVHNVPSHEVHVPLSMELALFKLTRIDGKVVREFKGSIAIDVVFLKLSLVHAPAREFECTLTMSLAFRERAFVM